MNTPRPGAPAYVRSRGGPLVMLALVLGGWFGLRIIFWQFPFAPPALAEAGPLPIIAVPAPPAVPHRAGVAVLAAAGRAGWIPAAQIITPMRAASGLRAMSGTWLAGLPVTPRGPAPPGANTSGPASAEEQRLPPASAPFLPPPLAPSQTGPRTGTPGRWSLDAWAFWRQGSDAAPVSQGRVPIYGASQMGAVLHYRLAPTSGHDPRLYARAYRALVSRGESELALGTAVRPLPTVPIRLAGEVRYTDTAFADSFRPAAYAVTELPPLRLPFGAQGEAYGQAGWVGGAGATWFADGQASLTRALPFVARGTDDRINLSLGAGLWGGAQRGAERVDIGPTLRLDTRIGAVPARLSVDWRQRVAGDASPGSGVAATVSAGF